MRRIYYFIHLTGRDPGTTGIQRVVRALGRSLLSFTGVEIVPVRWSRQWRALVHVEDKFVRTIALHGGPEFAAARCPGRPIHAAGGAPQLEGWLLVPEVPHLATHDARYPPVALLEPLGYARRHGLSSAVVFHDMLPLSHPALAGDEADRLAYTIYAQALLDADRIFPVSASAGQLLDGWFAERGYPAARRPRIVPIALPEEIVGRARRIPDPDPPLAGPIEFVAFGTVCARKNQLAALAAFNRVVDRRPDLDLALHIVGTVAPEVAASLANGLARSRGRARSWGYLPDNQLAALIERARATLFPSLAEGFGLPVAESLWLGTPCLCADIGATAEIAEGGGCVSVDPNDVSGIADAIERLAGDTAFYRRLMTELRTRRFRRWSDYAAEMLDELAEEPARPGPAKAAPGGPPARITIGVPELRCPDAYAGAGGLRRDGTIAYDRARHREIVETVLFFGPYITLDRGIYIVRLNGDLDGALRIRFTRRIGEPIEEIAIERFDAPLCLALAEPATEFEVLGLRTPLLKSMRLDSIVIDRIDPNRAGCGRSPRAAE